MSSPVKDGLTLILNDKKGPLLGIMCLLITAAILIAGLWPFNFHPSNKVEWLKNENGIRFYGRGIVFSPVPLAITGRASENASVTVEFSVRPSRESGYSVASILTLYDHELEQLILSQWKTMLIIRTRAAKTNDQRPYRKIGIANVLKKDTSRLITVTSGKEATDIYVDGKFNRRFPQYSLVSDDERSYGNLILGNSPEGTQSWNGAFLGLAIYDRILTDKEVLDHYLAWRKRGQPLASDVHASLQADKPTSLRAAKPIALYLFNEHGGEQIQDRSGNHNNLLVPATFYPLRRIVLHMPEKDGLFSRANLMDIAVNVIGFAPFGFFVSFWSLQAKNLPPARAYGITILVGFFLSLAIELAQVYLPGRDSSSLDVLSNVLGTAAGILLLKYAVPARQKNTE